MTDQTPAEELTTIERKPGESRQMFRARQRTHRKAEIRKRHGEPEVVPYAYYDRRISSDYAQNQIVATAVAMAASGLAVPIPPRAATPRRRKSMRRRE